MYTRGCGLHEGVWCTQGGVVCMRVCGVHKGEWSA